jgi:hypothetical protein
MSVRLCGFKNFWRPKDRAALKIFRTTLVTILVNIQILELDYLLDYSLSNSKWVFYD